MEVGVQTPDVVSTDAPTDNAALPLKVVQAIVTGYANGADGGAVGSMTASGQRTHWGTVAADWRIYPLGTRLQIEGFPNDVFTVEDSGSAIEIGEPQTIATIAHDRNRPSPREVCDATIGCPYRILEIEHARTNEGNPKSSGLVDGQSLRVAVGARGG